jgi:hypothetical protein
MDVREFNSQQWREIIKIQLTMIRRKWALYSALLAVVGGSALMLASAPAYAGTCTSQVCPLIETYKCAPYCSTHGGFVGFVCPQFDDPLHALCVCNGGIIYFNC